MISFDNVTVAGARISRGKIEGKNNYGKVCYDNCDKVYVFCM